jgi:hypothetical protein
LRDLWYSLEWNTWKKEKKKSKHEGKKEKQIQSAKEGWQHET